jgi:lipopolysaccharide/colanic/teichoic acid biosynthesis glycosyltransferase
LADFTLALIAIVVAAPLFVTIGLLIWVIEGRPVLYRGARLGRGKGIFHMYKFRTLATGAEHRVGGALLSAEHRLETRTGRFLRETRLDELPQLYNVLRGDMSFFGPRPIRPAVYLEMCRTIPGYDRRFDVQPGLVGYSQLFTPHGAPKRLRARIDNRIVSRRPSWFEGLRLVFVAATAVLARAAVKALRFLYYRSRASSLLEGHEQRRTELRVRHTTALVARVGAGDQGLELIGQLVDINERALRLRTPLDLREQVGTPIEIHLFHGDSRRAHRARCQWLVQRHREEGGAGEYVVEYRALGDASRYVIDQYLLGKSIVAPRRWRRGA